MTKSKNNLRFETQQEEYLKIFSGAPCKIIHDNEFENYKLALDYAMDIRKFEIEMTWKRSIYFFGFITLFLGGIALVANGFYEFGMKNQEANQ